MKTLILGLGNTLLKDDGIGIYVVRKVQEYLIDNENITINESSESGMALLDLLVGYDNLVVVDAIVTGGQSPGHIYRLEISDIGKTPVACSPHFTGLPSVVEFGEKCGYKMPGNIEIFAVEVEDPYTIEEALDPTLESKITDIAKVICNRILQSIE